MLLPVSSVVIEVPNFYFTFSRIVRKQTSKSIGARRGNKMRNRSEKVCECNSLCLFYKRPYFEPNVKIKRRISWREKKPSILCTEQ